MRAAQYLLEKLAKLSILIVEDENIVAKDLELTLKKLGYQVCGVAVSGSEAIRKAEELGPTLVLMDIRLRGEVDGVEAARQIRQRLELPVIFLTAHADRATLERAGSAEPYGYVLKPFDEQDLDVTIVMAVFKHQAFAEFDQRVHERTLELARSELKYRQIAAVAELGMFALKTHELLAVMERAARTVSDILGTDFSELLELQRDGTTLQLRAGVGWEPELVGRAKLEAGTSSHAGYTLLRGEPIVVEDLSQETRFSAPTLLEQHRVTSGICTLIAAPGHEARPYGVLGAHTRARRSFVEGDVKFLQAISNVVASAIVRVRNEDQLREAERCAQEQRLRIEQAEAAVRERDEFIAVAAHELRTPLQVLQLKLEGFHRALFKAPANSGAVTTPRIAAALRQANRLGELIERLLDVSRIASGRLELRPEACNIGNLVRDVVDDFREQAAHAKTELRLSLHGQPLAQCDRARIEQVLRNLLANAVKYGEGKPIDVQARLETSGVEISVTDRGIGISEQDVQRIFGRFERAVPVRHYGGLGLGLYIVRHIVEAHGGKIEVHSKTGQGSTFVVKLPLEPPQPPMGQS